MPSNRTLKYSAVDAVPGTENLLRRHRVLDYLKRRLGLSVICFRLEEARLDIRRQTSTIRFSQLLRCQFTWAHSLV